MLATIHPTVCNNTGVQPHMCAVSDCDHVVPEIVEMKPLERDPLCILNNQCVLAPGDEALQLGLREGCDITEHSGVPRIMWVQGMLVPGEQALLLGLTGVLGVLGLLGWCVKVGASTTLGYIIVPQPPKHPLGAHRN